MTLGNGIGVRLDPSIAIDDLFTPAYGSFLVELDDYAELPKVTNLVEVGQIGVTCEDYVFEACGETLDLNDLQDAWEGGIESVFPYRSKDDAAKAPVETVSFEAAKKTRVHRCAGGQAACHHPGVPRQQLRVRFRRRLRACGRGCDDAGHQQPDRRRPWPNRRRRWSMRSAGARSS